MTPNNSIAVAGGHSSDRPAAARASSGILSRWRWDLSCLIGMAAICLTRASFRSLPVMAHARDLMVALDAAWRVLNGQRPHVDFYSALGPLSSWSTALGLALAHGAAHGINYGTALLGFLVGSWSFLIARQRLAPPWAALIGISSVLLMVTPTPLGDPFFALAEAMFYNRYGYCLLAVILLEAYLPPEVSPLRERRVEFAGGFSTGFACCVLLFLKASYFFIAAPLVVVLLVARRQQRARIAGICAGFGVVLLAILAYLGFHVGAIVGDLRIAAGARTQRFYFTGYGFSLRGPLLSDIALLLLAALAGYGLRDTDENRRGRIPVWCRFVLAAAVAIGAGTLALVSNYEIGEMPLNGVFAVVLADAATRKGRGLGASYRAAVAAWALCLILPLMAMEARALVNGLRKSRAPVDSSVSLFRSSAMSQTKMMGPSRMWTNGAVYVDTINEGIDLLQRWSPPNETVYSLAFVNPFSYLLQRRPAPGGSTWLHAVYNFSEAHHPSPQRLLEGADVVMVPKFPKGDESMEYILKVYMGYVDSRFHLAAESEQWRLYRRNRP